MRKTFKYRLYPTRKQAKTLQLWLDLCRRVYNDALAWRREAWEDSRQSVNYYDQARQLPQLKRDAPELMVVHSQVLQDVLRRLDKAFQAFYRRCKNGEKPGYPRFKSETRYHSFTFPQWGTGAFFREGKLWLSKIGAIRIKLHRPIKGCIKTVTITHKAGRWYACFSVEVETKRSRPLPKTKTKTGKTVGIDVGVESFATLSDGTQIENPKWYRRAERRLAKAQRRVSRRKKGSNRRKKAMQLLQRAHEKVQNQRKDFHHKLSHKLVNENDAIYFEDLNVKGLVRNHPLAKNISDAGWGQFLRFVCYKAEEAGREAIAVPPQWTSQVCSGCGETVTKSLSQRWHRCPHCGLELHRDHNAALNIQRLGRSLQGVPVVTGAMN